MENKLIYRVEDSAGDGLYTSEHGKCYAEMYELDGRHPSPHNDPALARKVHDFLGKYGGARFGFCSLEQLKFWIYKRDWWDKLDAEGFVISMYLVPEQYCLLGNTQAIFNREKAEFQGEISFLTL